jgi:hypothetical protein
MMTGFPASVQDPVAVENAPIAAIFKLTFTDAPAPPFVLSSTTTMSFPVLVGALGVSGIVPVPEPCASTTKFSVLESALSGFCNRTLRFPTDCKSAAPSEAMHCVLESQVVDRELPLTRIVEPGPGIVAAKFIPVTSSVNPPAVPAYALVGASAIMAGPFVMVTVAVPDWPMSSELVATTVIKLGVGLIAGAVYNPVESIDPQFPGIPQAAPVIIQMTC